MKIEITGCDNCPFRISIEDYGINEYGLYCSYSINNGNKIKTDDTMGNYRSNLPHNCPITLNGGEITIKTKTD